MFSKLFSGLFGNREDNSTSTDDLIQSMEKLIVLRFRSISEESGGILAPTNKTSDNEILKVYRIVLTSFRDVAQKRKEHIPATNLNYIAFTLLHLYENMGEEFFLDHLNYQLDYYSKNGLRDDYKTELNLL